MSLGNTLYFVRQKIEIMSNIKSTFNRNVKKLRGGLKNKNETMYQSNFNLKTI